MIITYFAHLKDNPHRENDEDVLYALKKLGHKVFTVDDKHFDMKDVIAKGSKSDLFLFHKGGVHYDTEENYRLTLDRLSLVLANIKQNRPTCKLVFWYIDKIFNKGREKWIETILPLVDYGFTTDGTYIRRHNVDKLFDLKQAAPNKLAKGHKNPIYLCDIAYIGKVYGEARESFVSALSHRYGERFRVYNEIWGQDFADLCVSAKIIVAPDYPSDDFYWSDRIYRVLRCGGFLIHPRLYELTKSGIINGAHYIGYYNWEELQEAIDSFLLAKNNKIRKQIAKQGQRIILRKHTYLTRCQELLNKIQ